MSALNANEFNNKIARRYDGIRDYIVAHYRMNQRSDSGYWRDNAANDALSDNLKAIMTAWFTGADLAEEIARLDISKYYSSLSWHCLLAGYGTFPPDDKLTASIDGLTLVDMAKIDAFIGGCAMNFGSHKAALANLSV
jgi:tryptophan 6-halogenase